MRTIYVKQDTVLIWQCIVFAVPRYIALSCAAARLFERIWHVFTPEELAATLERVEEIQRDGGETTANGSLLGPAVGLGDLAEDFER